jgi:hypothetical protein
MGGVSYRFASVWRRRSIGVNRAGVIEPEGRVGLHGVGVVADLMILTESQSVPLV